MVLISASFVQGTTLSNQTTTSSDPWGVMVYSATISLSLLTTGDIYYSQAMLIGCADKSKYSWLDVVCTEVGTEDINVFIEYSNTPSVAASWVAGTTDPNLDAVGSTLVRDTIGVVTGTACQKYQSYAYARLKFVPGTTITTGGYLTFRLGLPKIAGLAKSACASVSNHGT